jgi:hypothetical protein
MPLASSLIFGRRQSIEMRVFRAFGLSGLRRNGFQFMMDLRGAEVSVLTFRV